MMLHRALALFTIASAASSCAESWSEVHLIPGGYRGSVLIVHGCESADAVPRESGASLYEIPSNGILLTSDASRDGWFDATYFYVSAEGVRAALPQIERGASGLGVSRRQAVAWYEGPLDVEVMRSNRSASRYFIGDSADREEWYASSEAQLQLAQELVESSCPPAG